jgi:hypothetical protein
MRAGFHPINLTFRFFLELAALYALGWWGTGLFHQPFRWLGAALLVIIAAIIWGTFRVPNDGSASGKAPVAVPGWLRLGLELTLFITAALAYGINSGILAALIFTAIFVAHYLFSIDRIAWLFKQK